MSKCAVCGDPIDERTSPKADYQGTTYSFCTEECREEFLKDPKHFAKPAPVAR